MSPVLLTVVGQVLFQVINIWVFAAWLSVEEIPVSQRMGRLVCEEDAENHFVINMHQEFGQEKHALDVK